MSYVTQLTSLLCAGMMMATSSLQTIAPQNDVNGNLFLVNRTYRVSKDYVPETTAAKVQGTCASFARMRLRRWRRCSPPARRKPAQRC